MTCEELFREIHQQKLKQNEVTYEVRNYTFILYAYRQLCMCSYVIINIWLMSMCLLLSFD